MEKYSKSQHIKIISAITVCFILIFSLMILTVSASATPAVVFGTDITATAMETVPDPTARPSEPVMPREGSVSPDDAKLDAKMKEALTVIKKVIEIDEKTYTAFSYNYNPGDGQYNVESWYFNWNSADGKSSVYASVSGTGKIINYGKYEYSDNYYEKYVKLAEISKADAKAKADEFLKKVFGKEFDGYRAYFENLSYPSDRYNFYYVLTKNGYDYANYTLSVDVDKINGDIMNFSRNDYPKYTSSDSNFNYQSASKIIDKDAALKACLDKIGIELVYTSNFDYVTKKLTINPIYRLKNSYDQFISAVDGSLVKLESDYYGPSPATIETRMDSAGYNNYGFAATAEDAAAGVTFTPAELAEIAKSKGYITEDKAISIISKAFDLKLGDLSGYQKNTGLQVDYINQDQYFWNINLSRNNDDGKSESYSISVDARNGNIISYSTYAYSPYDYYDYNGDGISDNPQSKEKTASKNLYSYEDAKKIVLEKIKEICPYYTDKDFELAEYGKGVNTENSSYYYFNLVRKVNGIKFENNSISVGFDNINGVINSYYLTWYEKAEFPKLDKVVSPETALNSIDAYDDYKIYYISNGVAKNGRTNAVLVYRFDNPPMVDPFTGKCIGWDFKELTANSYEPDYKDLDGNPSKDIINKLTDNGIYVWGGDKFDPDKGITKGELLNYLKFYTYNSYYFAQTNSSLFVSQNTNNGTVNKYLTEDLDKVLTKQEAARIICEIAGYGELAKHSEIFVYPFKDGKYDEQYKGYIAILKTFGIISGGKDGNYNATDTLTRAEAAELVYNIIMSLTGTKG